MPPSPANATRYTTRCAARGGQKERDTTQQQVHCQPSQPVPPAQQTAQLRNADLVVFARGRTRCSRRFFPATKWAGRNLDTLLRCLVECSQEEEVGVDVVDLIRGAVERVVDAGEREGDVRTGPGEAE